LRTRLSPSFVAWPFAACAAPAALSRRSAQSPHGPLAPCIRQRSGCSLAWCVNTAATRPGGFVLLHPFFALPTFSNFCHISSAAPLVLSLLSLVTFGHTFGHTLSDWSLSVTFLTFSKLRGRKVVVYTEGTHVCAPHCDCCRRRRYYFTPMRSATGPRLLQYRCVVHQRSLRSSIFSIPLSRRRACAVCLLVKDLICTGNGPLFYAACNDLELGTRTQQGNSSLQEAGLSELPPSSR
jgi:hypothetical protein